MVTTHSRKVHEKYHSDIKHQYKTIKDNNFTYFTLLKLLNRYIKPGDEILDVGCGAGSLSFYFGNRNFNVFAIDISQKAISTCNRTKKNLRLRNIQFKRISFPDEKPSKKFDFIILTEVIEHIQNDNLAIKTINQLLKTDGRLFLTTPSNTAPLYRWGITNEFDKRVGHERRYSEKELIALLKNNNFKIIKIFRTEGLLRNFLYVNPMAGHLIRFIKGPLVNIFMYIDNLSIKFFGFSNFIILAQKK